MSTNIEFAIRISEPSTLETLKKSLSDVDGIDSVKVYSNSETLVVKSSLPVSILQDKIESIGQRAVIKGYGGPEKGCLQAAVAVVDGKCGSGSGKIEGVVRFIQANEDECIVDGTIDGLTPGLHGLHVHELGDISDNCNRVGEHFSLTDAPHGARENDITGRHTGDLGNIEAAENGRAHFRFSDSVLKVWNVIGRSVVVTEKKDDLGKGNNNQSKIDGNCGQRLGCGIIARSAGLFENSKKICACDGVSLWDEGLKPSTGRQPHL